MVDAHLIYELSHHENCNSEIPIRYSFQWRSSGGELKSAHIEQRDLYFLPVIFQSNCSASSYDYVRHCLLPLCRLDPPSSFL